MKRYLIILVLALVVVALDQGTKIWADNNLGSMRPSRASQPHPVTLEVGPHGEGDDLADFIDQSFRMTSREDAERLIARRLILVNSRIQLDGSRPLAAGDQVVLLERQIEVVPNFFNFKYVENHGAAWGFLSDADASWRTPFFVIVSLVAIVFILILTYRVPDNNWMVPVAFGSILGGAVGNNLVDRVRLGYVIDFIDWHYKGLYHWPTFNIADAAICVGVGLLFVDMIQAMRKKEPEAAGAGDATRTSDSGGSKSGSGSGAGAGA